MAIETDPEVTTTTEAPAGAAGDPGGSDSRAAATNPFELLFQQFSEALVRAATCMPKPDPCRLKEVLEECDAKEHLAQTTRLGADFLVRMTALQGRFLDCLVTHGLETDAATRLPDSVSLAGELGRSAAAELFLKNPGPGKIVLGTDLLASDWRDEAGHAVAGLERPQITWDDGRLGPGETARLAIKVVIPSTLVPAHYHARLEVAPLGRGVTLALRVLADRGGGVRA